MILNILILINLIILTLILVRLYFNIDKQYKIIDNKIYENNKFRKKINKNPKLENNIVDYVSEDIKKNYVNVDNVIVKEIKITEDGWSVIYTVPEKAKKIN